MVNFKGEQLGLKLAAKELLREAKRKMILTTLVPNEARSLQNYVLKNRPEVSF